MPEEEATTSKEQGGKQQPSPNHMSPSEILEFHRLKLHEALCWIWEHGGDAAFEEATMKSIKIDEE